MATFAPISFSRKHHNAILSVLRSLDGDLLAKAKCYFGGGTAIALNLDEFRESVDIDFLCADQAGYRMVRTLIKDQPNLNKILRDGAQLNVLRDVRANQYLLQTYLECDGAKIKFEIVRESRIELRGRIDPRFGVPILDQDLMYAEKLLANSDRLHDPGAMNRDIIDLSMMILRWGAIPETAWAIALDAYGAKVREDYAKAVEKIRAPECMEKSAEQMAIDKGFVAEILALHGGALPRQPSQFD